MRKLRWIVDENLVNRTIHSKKIPEAISKLQNSELFLSPSALLGDIRKYKREGWENNQPCMLYGSIEFVRNCKLNIVPHSFGVLNKEQLTFASYSTSFEEGELLNSDFIVTTWADLKNNTTKYIDLIGNKVFARPNSGMKLFTGCVLDLNDKIFIDGHDKTTSITDKDLVVLAKPKEILGEFRFVIGDNRVLGGSEYRWDNILDVRSDYCPDCYKLAQKVANRKSEIDRVYTCDVALTLEGPKVIELNGFSSAGLYAINLDEVFPVIEEIAINTYNEIFGE